jgi:hypothetical protein
MKQNNILDKKFKEMILDIMHNQGDRVTDDYLTSHVSQRARFSRKDVQQLIPSWEQKRWIERDGRKGLRIRHERLIHDIGNGDEKG